ncbi:hypothetical protein BD770DRAFT_379648 [Pilaira anomala]|nr:hypothetical protein BD770DRAFT_379648 [Pilaira anomala]
MARPPPVIVTTLPTSLLSQRKGSLMTSPTQRSTTTPARPMTIPPATAAGRTNAIVNYPIMLHSCLNTDSKPSVVHTYVSYQVFVKETKK